MNCFSFRFCVFTGANLFVLGLVSCVLCISSLLLFGCQYQCNWLPGKTRPRRDLLCVEWDVKSCTLTHFHPKPSQWTAHSDNVQSVARANWIVLLLLVHAHTLVRAKHSTTLFQLRLGEPVLHIHPIMNMIPTSVQHGRQHFCMAPCGLRDCKNRAHSVSWPEVVKSRTKSGFRLFC